MERRTFLALGLAAPLALKSGLVSPKWAFSAEDNAIEVSFAADPNAPKVTMWQTPRQTGSQMMGYIFRTETGETVVFDGGTFGDADYLTALLKKHCGGKVDAWIMSHIHSDHFGAFCRIMETNPDALDIKKLYFNFPEQSWLDKYEAYCKGETARFFAAHKRFKGETITTKPGDVLKFGDALTIETLNDFDTSLTMNAINNSTIVFRLDVAGKSMLMLGDLGVEGGDRVLKTVPKEKIDCDFVQMAHHGQQGVTKEFYAAASPTVCLWPTPDWLWDNNAGGKGKNTGPWKTLETRAWMEELGIDKHYVSKDGLIKMTF